MTTIPTGRFVWFEYVAKDLPKAQGFFGELFGWTTQQIPMPQGSYTMIASGGQTIGGYMETPPGAPSQGHWLTHLQVQDANGAADRVKSLGGKVLKEPFSVGEHGRMSIVADPLGGVFALWQPAKAEGTGDFKGEPNNWCWNELYTADPEKSVAFYAKLGDFTEDKMQMKDGTYHILNNGGKGRAGILKSPMANIPQHWMPYVHVANVDQTIAKAQKLGATIMVAGEDVPTIGRLGILIDPQGGSLGLLQPEMT